MKKLLTILSSLSLVGTPSTVIACAAKDDDKKQDILDIINLAKIDGSKIAFSKTLSENETYQDLDNYIKQDIIPQVSKLINEEYKLNNYIKVNDLIYAIRDQYGRGFESFQKEDNLKNGKWYLDFYGNKPYIGSRVTTILTIKGSSLDYVSLNEANLPLGEFLTTAQNYINDLKTKQANLIIKEIESQLNDDLKGTFTINDLDISIRYQRVIDTGQQYDIELKPDEKIGGKFTYLAPWDKNRGKMTYRCEWFTVIKLKDHSKITGRLRYLHRIKESAVWSMEIDQFKLPQFVAGTATTKHVVDSIMTEEMRKIFIEDLSPFIIPKFAGENFPQVDKWVHIDKWIDDGLKPKEGENVLNKRGSYSLILAFSENNNNDMEKSQWFTGETLSNDDFFRGYITLWINIV